MTWYRCYFLDGDDHIRDVENIEADVLNEAIERGLSLLQERPKYYAVELWQGGQKIYPITGS